MAFSDLVFTKDWSVMDASSTKYFATHESDEATVRSDQQLLYNEIQAWINDAVDKLADCTNIGMGEASTLQATNVKDALIELKNSIVAGTVPDYSLGIEKMKRKSVEGVASVAGDNIADNCIDTEHLVADCVTGAKIADGVIEHTHLAEYEEASASSAPVGTKNIQNQAVTNAKIKDYSLTHSKLATTANPAGAAVENSNIVDGTITYAKLADGTIPTGKIADGAVTTAKIADSAVTNGKLAGSISADKLAGSIPLSKLVSGYNIPLANGGTGATTAANARTNLGFTSETWTFVPKTGSSFTKTVVLL